MCSMGLKACSSSSPARMRCCTCTTHALCGVSALCCASWAAKLSPCKVFHACLPEASCFKSYGCYNCPQLHPTCCICAIQSSVRFVRFAPWPCRQRGSLLCTRNGHQLNYPRSSRTPWHAARMQAPSLSGWQYRCQLACVLVNWSWAHVCCPASMLQVSQPECTTLLAVRGVEAWCVCCLGVGQHSEV